MKGTAGAREVAVPRQSFTLSAERHLVKSVPVKFPQRLNLLPAYAANAFRPLINAPSIPAFARVLTRPGKEARAARFIEKTEDQGDYVAVHFKDAPGYPLFYPKAYRWVDFCQTVDECCNPENWHNFLSPRFAITKEDVVVDCGAAEGLFAFCVSSNAGKVFAFEPDSGFIRAMEKTFATRGNVTVRRCALGHRSGTAYLSSDEIFSRMTAEGAGMPVPIVTLDAELTEEKVTFIKADVEGYEFRVLLGAEALIRANRPRIAVTAYHPQNNVAEIQDFLRECHSGYRFATKGIYDNGHPVMFQAWTEAEPGT